jgi:hypothetical protein
MFTLPKDSGRERGIQTVAASVENICEIDYRYGVLTSSKIFMISIFITLFMKESVFLFSRGIIISTIETSL